MQRILRPYFHKVGLAPLDGICSTDVVVVRPRTPSWKAFALGHLSSSAFVTYTTKGADGTRMPRTSWERMGAYRCAIPPGRLAESYKAVIAAMLQRIGKSVFESRTLSELRDVLLPKLLSGELRIKDAERFVADAT